MTDTSASPPVSGGKRIELTLRALVLGCLLAVIFTAANTYLGLKVGLTFASAIPAAVISMAILRLFKDSTIWENMTVQTVASVGGAMSSIIFVLPGLVMVGWWLEFPFWESVLICVFGGVLGVTFSIPLRRALVVDAGLPYPEGVAAAEVLTVGSRGAEQTESAVRENASGLWVVIWGSIVSAGYALLVAGRVFAGEAARFIKLPASLGGGATGLGFGMQFALLGAGHLIGLSVGLAQLFGLILAWGIAVPVLTSPETIAWMAAHGMTSITITAPLEPGYLAEDLAKLVWAKEVRFIGAGVIGVAAIWTLIKLAGPLIGGLTSALAANRRRQSGEVLDRTEQDIPINIVAGLSVACLIGIGFILAWFAQGNPTLASSTPLLVGGGLIYVVFIGFAVAAICGYMAGLIGSSNSPVSGVGILAVVIASVLMLGVLALAGLPADPSVVAFALIVTAIVFAVAVIANDNLQDLKTGQLVQATPWRQQTALIVGVFAGALVIPLILNLLNKAFGFEGGPAGIADEPLAAPQATLISALARGVIGGDLRWDLIGLGAAIGVVIIVLDAVLNGATKGRMKLPPLAVGIGFYLPAAVTTMLVVGAVCGWVYDKAIKTTRFADVGRRMGVLLASGLIVGESLFLVMTAGVIVSTGNDAPFAMLPEGSTWPAMLAGTAAFVVLTLMLYGWVRNRSARV